MADQAIQLATSTDVHNAQPWYLMPHERAGHVLVVGNDGPAKQALLWNMMVQDIAAGAGACIIDVTGRHARDLLHAVPAARANHVLYFKPGDQNRVVGFNPFHGVPAADRPRAAQHIVALFEAVWSLNYDSHPLLLRLLRASARALLDSEEGTLLGMYVLLTNADYRQRIVSQCQDPLQRRFWADFESWKAEDQRDKPQPVLTRLEAFLSDPLLRNVLGQTRSTLDLDRVVRDRQVLVADLPRQAIGAETAKLFGCLLATRVQTILEGREGGWPFYVYLPEAHQVHVALLARAITSQLKNAGLVAGVSQLVGHERSDQNALLGAQRVVAFRLGPDDARLVAGRFPLPQAAKALTTLGNDRLAISGARHELQALERLPGQHRAAAHIQRRSNKILGVSRVTVEDKIERFLNGFDKE